LDTQQRFQLRWRPRCLRASRSWEPGANARSADGQHARRLRVIMAAEVTMTTVTHAPGTEVTVRGRKLWLEREGKGEPVLLLAGLGPAGSHNVFHPAFSELARDHEVLYLDLFGRGCSARPQSLHEITFASDVVDVAALIEELDRGPLHVYGFSYGGLLAQALALQHGRLVRSLVLANTLHSPEMWQANHANINRELANQYPEIWEQILDLRKRGMPSTAPEMQRLFAASMRLVRFCDPENADRLFALSEPGARNTELYPVFCGADVDFIIGGEVPRIPDFRPLLREISCPMLVVAGRFDRALYPRWQREFAAFAPQARFVMMERSGSFAHVEEGPTLMALLREFFASAGSPP
jgi:proline iminopeptidase